MKSIFLLAPAALAASPLTPVANWPLTSLAPRGNLSKFDHLLSDASTGLLYVSGKAIDVLFAVDVTSGLVVKTLDLASPQGLAVARDGLLWAGSDEGGNLTAVDRATFAAERVFTFSDDTDDVHLDARTGSLFVSSGDNATGGAAGGQAMIVEVSAHNASVRAYNFFPAHVEGFALVPRTDFIVASTPDAGSLHVLDKGSNTITASWAVPAPLGGVTPLLFDSATQTVIAAARTPGALFVFDYADGGKVLATVDCECGDADDIWLDSATKTVFISSGEVVGEYAASITAFRQVSRGVYTLLGQSRPAGKTSTFDAARGLLFTAVPDTGAGASIQVYRVAA
jgi:hypothetical protein